MAAVGVKTADFTMLSGSDLVKTYTAPIVEQPPAYQSYFCSNCGSPVPNPNPEGSWFEIAAGLFDDPIGIQPDKHIFVELIPDWSNITDDLPQLDKQALIAHRSGSKPVD